MPVLKNIENKIRLVTVAVIVFVAGCVVISLGSMITAKMMVSDAEKRVYVIDDNVPIRVTQKEDVATLDIEAKSLVEMFHTFFFTLSPDEKYIDYTMKKALYLSHNSGQVQYNLLKERGFYQNVISTNTLCTLYTDSIKFSTDSMKFVFYGRQRLERASMVVYRSLVTSGYVKKLPGRSENNPYGMMIVRWRIIDNRDLSSEAKTNY